MCKTENSVTVSSRCGMPAVQAALGLWKHMVQLAGKTNTGENPASKAATWTPVADYSTPVLLALAAMPPGVCDIAEPGQDAATSSAVLQVCVSCPCLVSVFMGRLRQL